MSERREVEARSSSRSVEEPLRETNEFSASSVKRIRVNDVAEESDGAALR